ncbi:MAG TPA: SpoIIE family protein phosphatase [Bryobacteraceae bacterium]|nr:SpoIIE family protein phosphatase [Bryobacteraceae bacterium]
MSEILIQSPDGQSKTVPLTGERYSLGRSSTADLCFPDDAGLSRQHLLLDREGDDWTVQDLGSKNGTLVNNIPLKGRLTLRPGDRISAGHLTITFDLGAPDSDADAPGDSSVVFYEGAEREPSGGSTIMNLKGALSNRTMIAPASERGAIQLQALIRAGQLLAGNRPLNVLCGEILELAVEAAGAERGVLLVLEDDRLVVKANKGEGFRISSAVRDRVLTSKESILVGDAQLDEAFRSRHSIVEQKVRSLMAVPLQTEERILGLIYVDSPTFLREFSKDDLSLLTVMANTAAIRLEQARLAEVEEMERRLARELEQAAEIQRLFLPESAPAVPGVSLAGYNEPCRTVGGDYYDFFPYPNGRVAMALGDVSGKGMPASLMMMGLQARVQVLAAEPQSLAAVMNRLNKATCAHCPSNRFITFFFCVLDPATGEIAYCNAGHNPPFVVRSQGAVELLDGGGPPLGILAAAAYQEYRARLEPGDLLAIYSDGVTDATNPQEEEFGEERFADILVAHASEPPEAIIAAVNQAITAWEAGAPAADDITLVVAKRAAAGVPA